METTTGSDSVSQSSAGCFAGGSYAFTNVVYDASGSVSDSLSGSGTGSSTSSGSQSGTSSGICTSGNDTSYTYSGGSSYQYSSSQATSDSASESEQGSYVEGSYSFSNVSYSATDTANGSSQNSGNDWQSSRQLQLQRFVQCPGKHVGLGRHERPGLLRQRQHGLDQPVGRHDLDRLQQQRHDRQHQQHGNVAVEL